MSTAAKRTRENRTITVDFRDEATYLELLGDGKAFLECILAFVLSLGFQLTHKATCRGGGCLTRHSHYVRVRLGGVTIWRIQCTTCKAVFTVLPHFVLRYRQMRPEVARDALLATHGGLSLELSADAGVRVSVGIGVPVYPPPVVVAPPPAVLYPAPVVVVRPPAVVAPPPVVYGGSRVSVGGYYRGYYRHRHPHWRHHHHPHWRRW